MRMPTTAGSGPAGGDGPADGSSDGTGGDAAAHAHGARRGPGRAAAQTLRRHWLIAALLLAGLILRALSVAAYQPALLYIDSLKYLFGAWPGNDPLGYNVILKVLLAGGNLNTVTVIQHLVGLAMAGVLYVLLLRRGTPRWLAALAAAPVLLDAYQVQIEQTIMPDVWFEALIVAGLALLLWRPEPGPRLIAAGGLALGASAPIAQVGQILIVPAVVYLLIVEPGWRRKLVRAAVLCAAFAVPIAAFSLREYVVAHQFSLAPAAGSTIYGRLAESADCAALKLPSYERAVCPPRALAIRLGPDGLVHDAISPDHTYVAPPGRTHGEVIANFEHRVITQQPLRVAGGVLGDAIRLFEVHRVTSTGDTPISRWQFQASYPTYGDSIYLSPDHTVMLGLHFASSGGPVQVRALPASMGGRATVDRPLAYVPAGLPAARRLHAGTAARAGHPGRAGRRDHRPGRQPGPGPPARLPSSPAAPGRPGLPAGLRLGPGRAARLGPVRVLLALPAAGPGHAPAGGGARPGPAGQFAAPSRRSGGLQRPQRNHPGQLPRPGRGGTAGSRSRRAG